MATFLFSMWSERVSGQHVLCGYLVVTARRLLLRQEGKARSVTAERVLGLRQRAWGRPGPQRTQVPRCCDVAFL